MEHSKLPMKCYMNELIQVLQKLEYFMSIKGEYFRAKAYQNAIDGLVQLQHKDIHIYSIDDLKQLDNVKGIGETIVRKCKEYIQSGKLNAIEKEEKNPLFIFSNIYGIGPKKAKELVEKEKLHSIEDLHIALETNPKILNDTQKIGLRYYEDILQRIPRKEIEEYETCFKEILQTITKSTSDLETFEIVGSYRRNHKDSGDIDVIFTNSNNDTSLLDRFVEECLKQNIIIELLSKGKTKSLVICKLPNYSKYRRVDFLYSPIHQFPFALLYFTGSALFNTGMRQRALELGYTLNEHELCHISKDKIKGKKVEKEFHTEKDIFDFLHIQYKEPHERIDGNSIENVSLTVSQDGGKRTSKHIQPNMKQFIQDFIQEFRTNGILHLQILNENKLTTILKEANRGYYNEEPFLTDSEYDILKEFIETKYPQNKVIEEVGAIVEGSTKVELPFYMGSMNKIKPNTNAIELFKKKYKNEYVLSTKLDGISALYDSRNNSEYLYTRGNGSIGQNISHMIPYLRMPKKKNIVLRGELIIRKDIFETKYKDNASNARNFVGGLVNSKFVSSPTDRKNTTTQNNKQKEWIEKIKDIEFICYELIEPIKRPSKQFEYMKKHTIQCASYETIHESKLTNSYLSSLLVQWREHYEYEIDGVICTHNKAYVRKNGKNPDYAFAFKTILTEQLVEAKVIDVIWTPSKDGLLKPRVRVEPVMVNGVKIEYATGFNAKFIQDNTIGVGAIIQLVRSGDVIPHILDVLKKAVKVKMPDVEYTWNESNVDIIVVSKESDIIVKEKNITYFFKGLDIEGLGPGNIKKIMNAGFCSIKDILNMSYDDYLKVNGFKEKMANKLYTQIQNKVAKAPLHILISVSNVFGGGFGEKKVKKIIMNYPSIFTDTLDTTKKIELVSSIDGFAKKSASSFVNKLPNFIEFMNSIGLKHRLDPKEIQSELHIKVKGKNTMKQHPLYDKSIVMSGFRDKDLTKKIEDVGGVVNNTITKETFILLVKDVDEDTSKINKAKKLNIPLMNPKKFKTLYF